MNAINFETGKKLHCNNTEYAEMKDTINALGLEKGLSVLNWRQPSPERVTTAEKRIQFKGGASWKEELKEVITEAILKSSNFEEFTKHLKNYDVSIERNTEKTISFKHPEKERPIRGDKLGQLFTKGAIMNGITEQRNRVTGADQKLISGAASPNERSKTARTGKQSVERSIDGVQREIRGIAEGIKQYTPEGREELRKRADQERREAERIARERESAKERQRAIELEHQKRDRGFDLER